MFPAEHSSRTTHDEANAAARSSLLGQDLREGLRRGGRCDGAVVDVEGGEKGLGEQ